MQDDDFDDGAFPSWRGWDGATTESLALGVGTSCCLKAFLLVDAESPVDPGRLEEPCRAESGTVGAAGSAPPTFDSKLLVGLHEGDVTVWRDALA